MASILAMFQFIFSTVMLFCFVNSKFISSSHFNATSSHESGRTKRFMPDRMPYLLRIQVKYRADEQINILWRQKYPVLVNKHLPIIIPFADSNQDVMSNIGDFVMYYDAIKCSAVVYFHKLNAFYGVIGTNYQVEGLPFDFDESGDHRLGIIGEPFIQKNTHSLIHINPQLTVPPPSDVEAWNDYLRPSNNDIVQNSNPSGSCIASTSAENRRMKRNFDEIIIGQQSEIIAETNSTIIRKRRDFPRDREFYLEILVFVTRDIVETFKNFYGENDYIEWLVMYLMIYFNAVDTMFRPLSNTGTQLFLNIAGIIIEDDLTPFNFITGAEFRFGEVAVKLPKYLVENRQFFPPDSFDHVFIYTSRAIMDGVVEVNGITKHGADLYEAKSNNQFYDAVPITALQFQNEFADYSVAVHEIGRMLDLRIDPKEAGSTSSGQCYSIMQREGPKCDGCLKWSDNSITQFIEFFHMNRNRCFLMNEPRSIQPPGARKYLSPFQQCRCFGGFRFSTPQGKSRSFVKVGGCSKPLRCTIHDSTWSYVTLSVNPFDGTPCSSKKVCWNGKCIWKNT